MTKRKAPEDKKPTGRPTSYTPEVAEQICRRIADGESLRMICMGPLMPARHTVRNWVVAHPAFFSQYARARQEQAHALWDEAIDNIRTADDSIKVARARVFLEATAKLAGKLAPKVYGEVLEEQPLQPPQGDGSSLTGPSDIVLARQLMYLVHRVMARQATNGAEPAPSLLGVEHQSRH